MIPEYRPAVVRVWSAWGYRIDGSLDYGSIAPDRHTVIRRILAARCDVSLQMTAHMGSAQLNAMASLKGVLLDVIPLEIITKCSVES